MPRTSRHCPPGVCFHVLNRAVGRMCLFAHRLDYTAFEQALLEAHARESLPILAYAIMPNHWHFVVRPTKPDQVSMFFRWLTLTHAMRWRAAHDTVGHGHLYQGRFKAFPIEEDAHLLAVLRYVEQNPVRAALCRDAADWPFGSARRRRQGGACAKPLLADWPIDVPADWVAVWNAPQPAGEIDRIRTCSMRGAPYGTAHWTAHTAVRLGLTHTLRTRGRPGKGDATHFPEALRAVIPATGK